MRSASATYEGLIESEQRARWWFVSGAAALFAAVLVLAIQTDVIGDPWVGYCVWALAGIALAPGILALRA